MENLMLILRLKLTKKQAEKVISKIPDDMYYLYDDMAKKILSVVKDVEDETPTVVIKKKLSEDALEIAESLKNYVIELYPYYEPKINVCNWADDIRLMHDVDHIEYRVIDALVRYLFEMYSPNSDFDWREQIRSGRNLRKHWIRLYELAKKDYKISKIETV